MALVKCKECGKKVSSAAPTCPNCGVPEPGAYELCSLRVYRKSQLFGMAMGMDLFVDNQYIGKLWNDQMIDVKVPPGKIILSIRATLYPTTEINLDLKEGRKYSVEANWNLLGATLKLHDA
jgi:hypothetical protein